MAGGNITKTSNGTIREAATSDYTVSAKSVQTNAGQRIVENSNDGVVYGEPEQGIIKDDLVDIAVGMFFDGTGNNRKNIDTREANPNSYQSAIGTKYLWQDNTSYENDRTNVDKLEKMYPKQGLYFSIYIEGIGTTNDAYDTLKDMGLGTGGTGIREKVRKGCEELVKQIKSRTPRNINTLTIDVFGFSRGAAAARNFVHEVTKAAYEATVVESSAEGTEGAKLYYDEDMKPATTEEMPARGHLGVHMKRSNLKINAVRIRLAGLYDTVSAYGANHKDDLGELHLNAVNQAAKIVHLTAADEHREKFELTSVTTGIELTLPGVHSDVGGSYRDNVAEDVSLAEEMLSVLNRTRLIQAERNRLIEQGWYRAEQMQNTQPYKLTGRRILSNRYSLLPLHLMLQMGKDKVTFDEAMLTQLYTIPTAPLAGGTLKLPDVYKRLEDYAIKRTAPPMLFNNTLQLGSLKRMLDMGAYDPVKYARDVRDHQMLLELRNKYLHFSSSWDGVGKEPSLNEAGERERVVFNKRH